MKEPFDYEAARVDTVASKNRPGDYVIPVEIQGQNRGLMAQAKKAVANAGADAEAYVAGSTHGNYNPATGDQQFFLKKVKKAVKKVGKGVKKGVKKVGRGLKKAWDNPIVRSAAIGAGMFFGVPAAAGALKIGKAGAAGAAAAKAAGGGLIKSSAGWWSGTFGMGAGGAAARAAGTPGMFGAKTAASVGAQQMAPAVMGQPQIYDPTGGFAWNQPNPFQAQGGGGGFLSSIGRGAANIWGGMDGSSRAALITGGFGAAGGWADAKMQEKIRSDDRKHEMNMEQYKTDVERENFDDRNRIMGMGRDGQGGVEIDPNMVANWGLGDMSLPRRTHEDLPPPNTPMSDKLRAGFLAGA